jgi:hypothetical protein
MIQALKSRWGIDSNRRFAVILLAFSLAGPAMLLIKNPVLHLLHIPSDASLWVRIPIALLLYQILLLGIGALLGEFSFFWEKLQRLGRLFGGRQRK